VLNRSTAPLIKGGIANVKLLTPQAEIELAARIKKGAHARWVSMRTLDLVSFPPMRGERFRITHGA